MKWYLGVIGLLLLALVFQLGLMAYAMYALLGVMLVSRFLARSWAQNLSAERECNRFSANVGDTVAVVLTVKNRGALPVVWVLLEDLLPQEAVAGAAPRLEVVGSCLKLAMLAPAGHKTVFYQLRPRLRGYYQIGPLVLETGDLFGLHRRFRMVTAPHFLLVYPKVIPLQGYDVASRQPIGEVRLAHRLYEDPTRIAGVREYQAGDPLNRVHWRATARTGALHSKVYEPSTVAGATILLDFHRDRFDPNHEPVRSELAITAAASVANALYQMGQQVGLITNGRDAVDRIRREGWDPDPENRLVARQSAAMLQSSDRLQPIVVQTCRGPEQLMRILETLARLELTDGLPLDQTIAETASRMPRDATVLAILSSVTMETAVALGDLRRRGFAVTVLADVFHLHEFEAVCKLLMAEGIEARQVAEERDIATMCEEYAARGSIRQSLVEFV
jgi:uncharacterized repeat protein (TIGR01451 family)